MNANTQYQSSQQGKLVQKNSLLPYVTQKRVEEGQSGEEIPAPSVIKWQAEISNEQ